MFDLWSFRGIDALVSSGLGGGSLIYANVLLRKDERWFVSRTGGQPGEDEDWPISRADLDPHYDRVEQMLRAQRYPFDHAALRPTPKTRAFEAAAEGSGWTGRAAAAGRDLRQRRRPPVPGSRSRRSVRTSTAPRAHLPAVRRVRRRLQLRGQEHARLHLPVGGTARRRRDAHRAARCVSSSPLEGGGWTRPLHRAHAGARPRATSVESRSHGRPSVLSAGTLGSHLPAAAQPRAPSRASADRLGTRFSRQRRPAHLRGSCPRARRPARGRLIDPARGPVITSAIRYPDELDGDGEGRGFYLEDAGYPEFVSWMLQAADAPGSLRRAADGLSGRSCASAWSVTPRATSAPRRPRSWATASSRGGVLPLLGMGRDMPDGQMSLTKAATSTSTGASPQVGRRTSTACRRSRAASCADALGAAVPRQPALAAQPRHHGARRSGGCPMGRTRRGGRRGPLRARVRPSGPARGRRLGDARARWGRTRA